MLYDIAIIGAGPAGATAALALRDTGLQVLLLDQGRFPRDKVCGDAIPALCGKVLNTLDPTYLQALQAFPAKTDIASCQVIAPNGTAFEYHFHTRGWCSPRLHFDDFLLRLVQGHTSTHIIQGTKVTDIQGQPGQWQLITPAATHHARLIIGADGANGLTAKRLAQHHMIPEHHCAAVRAYYTGIQDLQPQRMEIHLPAHYLPGYLWIFPVGDGTANVGFGMLSSDIAKRKLALRELLPTLLQTTPYLQQRFAQATPLGPVTGFGLPMGSRRRPLSGHGFLLTGDAASLIEPATGEGIGNAMVSGRLAAHIAAEAIQQNDLRHENLKAYDAQLYARLWSGLRNKYLAQRLIGGRKHILNLLIGAAGRPGPVRWLMRQVF